MPEPDFQLALYLVPELLKKHESVAALVALDGALQTGRYEKFWQLAQEPDTRAILDSVTGLDGLLRGAILRLLNRVYQRVEVASVRAWLNTVRVLPAK